MAESPIADDRDNDIILMRKHLLVMIKDEEIPKKDRIEASKLLARMHHALQVDRSVAKPADTDKFKKKMPKLKPEHQKKIQALLDGVEQVRH